MNRKLLSLGMIFTMILIVPVANGQTFEKATFQETATLIYDEKLSDSLIISIGLETTDNREIKFPDELIKKIKTNEKIRSVVFTNVGECVMGVTTEQQCVMINFSYEELKGDGGINMVQNSAREIGDSLIKDLNDVLHIDTKFHSVYIHTTEGTNALLETSGAITGKGTVSATYVTDKRATDFLFTDISSTLIPKTIRDGGGFYDISKKLSKDDNSIISITIITNDDSNLLMLKVAKEIKNDNMNIESINILEEFGVEKITRTDYFDGKNVPLNSLIHLIVISNENKKINEVTTHVIPDLKSIENVMKKGWFFHTPAGNVIDLRFLFGDDKTILKEELLVKIASWDMESQIVVSAVEDMEEQTIEDENYNEGEQYIVLGIIIVIGIAAAIFYLKGYKPKH